MATTNNNETVHISLGTTANYVTSHLLNLQGLAATSSSGRTNNNEDCHEKSLCDPSVTHDISPIDDTNVYSSSRGGTSSSSSSRYMYVPRTLIVDGRDSFGPSWGGVSCNNNVSQHNETSSSTPASAGGDAWNGTVSIFNASDHGDILFGSSSHEEQQRNDDRIPQQHTSSQQFDDDPLRKFHTAASIMGLSQQHSRFNASIPSRYISSVGNSSSSRHVQWDEENEEEEDDDNYCYGRSDEDMREEKRRQLEKMEHQQIENKKSWNRCMEDAWEEAFYSENTSSMMSIGSNEVKNNAPTDDAVGDITAQASSTSSNSTAKNNDAMGREREIQWYDYWMPPKPSPTKYRVPLPFDTAYSSTTNTTSDSKKSVWSTSFHMGYNPSSSGGGGENNSARITNLWRQDVLSESLRKVLEECDVVKGFNIFVDGGSHDYHGITNTTTNGNHTNSNRHAKKQLSNIMTGGGGFHAGLATSLLEELSEECKSAGRWVVMVDPPLSSSSSSNMNTIVGDTTSNTTEGNQNQIHRFRQSLNAGLALHGLSTNADAFLPVSIDGAYNALRGATPADNGRTNNDVSTNRMLFEGSAAVALALETSTLSYRLHRHPQPTPPSSHSSGGRRSRIGIQSGFYQGSTSGNGGYHGEFDNEPYATAPSLTYHEFLACARPSSDKRRSILELDALLRPISFSSSAVGNHGNNMSALAAGSAGINVASLLSSGGGTTISSSMLASLTSSGLIGGSTNGAICDLQKQMMRGTSVERMMMEQQRQQFRSSRNNRGSSSSSRSNDPGEWMEDMSTYGGLLSSLSGNSIPFGRRADHHHFALSTSLRLSAFDARSFGAGINNGDCATSAFLRPMMESMGVKYRPEVSVGAVVKDSVVDLTGVGSYWRSVFADRSSSPSSTSTSEQSGESGSGNNLSTQASKKACIRSPMDIASNTSILSVLGNSTRSYPRIHSISTGFVDALHSRRNMGYLSRDVMAGIIPEQDDCEEALEHCQELADVYEPPMGSGLVVGEDDDLDAYFDDED